MLELLRMQRPRLRVKAFSTTRWRRSAYLTGLAVRNLARTHQRKLAEVVHMVVPLHELLRPVPGILQGSMRCTPNGGSFPGRLETGLPELRVVGGHVGPSGTDTDSRPAA